MAATVYKQIK